MVKISSGKYRGRNIETPSVGTIPTKNRVREAMFSAAMRFLPGATVLDLFAGSGALGIEALSRGAKKAYFVDASAEAVAVVKKNLNALRETNGVVVFGDYLQALSRMNEPFDLVFLDPPYANKEAYQNAIDALDGRGLLKQECAVMMEYEGELDIDSSRFTSRRDYSYGKSKVLFLWR